MFFHFSEPEGPTPQMKLGCASSVQRLQYTDVIAVKAPAEKTPNRRAAIPIGECRFGEEII